ncbi:MAG: hypothetical protein AAF974_00235 [Cyanobacteria bacterium P01_E01_bin.34]
MSSIVERALRFYLEHPDIVEGSMGQAHRVHSCPVCESSFVMRRGMPQPINQKAAILEDSVTAAAVQRRADELRDDGQPDLVTC